MKLFVRLAIVLFVVACREQEPLDRGITLHLTVEIDTSQVAIEARDPNRVLQLLRARVDALGVGDARLEIIDTHRIAIEVAGVQDAQQLKTIVQRRGFLEFKIVTDGLDLVWVLPKLDSAIVATSPGLDELRPLTALLLESGEPGSFLVEEPQVEVVQGYLTLPEVREKIPNGVSLGWGSDALGVASKLYRSLYVLEAVPLMTGEYLADAQATYDEQHNVPLVIFELTHEGGRLFERRTSRHVGDRMAIVLDGRVRGNPPVIRDPIGRRGQIELGTGASLQDAQDLALILRTGALPMRIKIVEERVLDPESPELE